MAESLCNKFKGGKCRIMPVQEIKEMLQVHGQIMQVVRLGFLNTLTVGGNNTYGRQGLLNDIIAKIQAFQTVKLLRQPSQIMLLFQTEDLDAYDSNCDDVSNAKAVLMANLSNYGFDVISEVPHSEPYHIDMDNQSVHAMQDFKQTSVVDFSDNEIMSDSNIISYSHQHAASHVIDDEETLILEELQTSNPNTKQSDISPDSIEAPSELPKVSLVNTSHKKLKFHLSKFDTVVKKRITPDAITEEELGFEHTKAVFLKEIIPFLTTLKDIFNVFDKDLLNEVKEVETVFNQMEAAVQQCSVDKQCFEIVKKEFSLKNDRLLQQIMSRDILLSVMNSTTLNSESVNVELHRSESCDKCFDLDAEISKT
ncbi:hypothetical protein Tco_0317224 [Tanacetum coccineum]